MPELITVAVILAVMGLFPAICGKGYERSEFGAAYLSGTSILIMGTGLLCRLLGLDILTSISIVSGVLFIQQWRMRTLFGALSFDAKEILPVFLLAMLIAVPHFLPALKIENSAGGFAFAEPIFDLDHWIGGLVGVAADGLPVQHYQAPDAQFLYYFGAYMIPGAVMALFPGHVASVMASLFVMSSVALGLSLMAVLRKVIARPLWRVLAVLAIFTGLSLTLRVHLSEGLINTLVTHGWATASYTLMEPASYVLFWQWHHVMALALGLHLLSIDPGKGMKAGIIAGACLACSPYVFLLMAPSLCLRFYRPVITQWKVALALLSPLLLSVAVFYGDVVMAVIHHDMSSNGALMFRTDIRASVLDTLSIGFVPLLVCLFYRPVTDKTLLGLFLTSFFIFIFFDGELSTKAFSAAQIFGVLFVVVALVQLKAQNRRRVFYSLLALVLVVASVNTVKSGKRTIKATGNVMALQSQPTTQLMGWVADNTKLSDRVSMADDTRIFNYHLSGRRGVDAGEGRYARLGAQTASLSGLEHDRTQSSSLAWGWDQSDYVVQLNCDLPMGLISEHDIYQARTSVFTPPEDVRFKYTKVLETSCGVIWKNRQGE